MKNMLSENMWGGLHNLWPLSVILVVIACCLLYRYQRSLYVVTYLVNQHIRARLLIHFSRTRLLSKFCLFFLGALSVGIALLMPRWGMRNEPVIQESRDVMIALDISRSMLTRDCFLEQKQAEDRLTCAKKKILALLNYLTCERIGLILFSGSSFIQCPLTTDYGAFKLFLDLVTVETIASGSTAIDQAITQALRMYQACPDRRNKLLILMTDGEDFSHNLQGIKEQAARVGMHIFALALGTQEGAPIPLYNTQGKQEGYQKDEQGAVVISRLNESLIKSLTTSVGGKYVSMTQDDSDVQEIAQQIANFEKEHLDNNNVTSLQEQYHYCIALALLCFIFEWFL